MADININIKEVKAPSLTSAEYGKNLSECFSVINDNFKTLANRDFVKGDKGDSIYTVKSPLVTKKNADLCLTKVGKDVVVFILKDDQGRGDVYQDIIEEIQSTADITREKLNGIVKRRDKLEPIGEYYTFDNLFNEDLYFELITDSNGNYIGAANYIVFKDKRFNNETISSGVGEDDSSLYVDKVDLSCIICVESKEGGTCGYVALHDIPSLYYSNKYKRFCWKIGNIETGMIAQGPAGKDGNTINVTRVVYVDLDTGVSLWSGGNDVVKTTIKAWKAGDNTDKDVIIDLKITAFQNDKTITRWSDKGEKEGHTEAWEASASTGDDKIFEKNYPAIIWVSYTGTDGSEAGTLQNNCFISTISSVEPTNGQSLYVAVTISKQTLILNNLSNDIVETTFNNMLRDDSHYTLKGLHVPYNTSGLYSHMIWPSNTRNSNDQSTSQVLDDKAPLSHLNMSAIFKFPDNPNYWDVGVENTTLNLTYPTVNIGDIDGYISITGNKISSKKNDSIYSPVFLNNGAAIGETTFTLTTKDKTIIRPKRGDIQYSDGPLYIQDNSQGLVLGYTQGETTINGKTVNIVGNIVHAAPYSAAGMLGYTLETSNLVADKLNIDSFSTKKWTSTIDGKNLDIKCPITLGKASLYYDTSYVDSTTDAVSISDHLQVGSSIFTPKLQLSEEGAMLEVDENGGILVSGDARFRDGIATDADLWVYGDAEVASTLKVTGASTFEGAVELKGPITVNGSTTLVRPVNGGIKSRINSFIGSEGPMQTDVYGCMPIGSIMLWFISPNYAGTGSSAFGYLTPENNIINDFPEHWFPCTLWRTSQNQYEYVQYPIYIYNDSSKYLHSQILDSDVNLTGTQAQVYDYLVNLGCKSGTDQNGSYAYGPNIKPPTDLLTGFTNELVPIYIMKYE